MVGFFDARFELNPEFSLDSMDLTDLSKMFMDNPEFMRGCFLGFIK